MAYIGRQLARGENRIFDDISSSFNGSTTVFNLTISSVATSTATPYQLFVSLGGVMQKPGVDFTTAGNQITFTTAPAAGLSCWIMIQGDAIDAASVSDGSVTPSKISGSGDFAFPADIRLKDSDGSHYVGFEAPATVSTNKVWTLPAADGSADQILTTNGSGVLSWSTVAGGLSSDAQKNTVGGTNAGDSFTGTDATNNTLIGYDAGTAVTTGDYNIAIGSDAGEGITSGSHNVSIGFETNNASNISKNVAIGYRAGKANNSPSFGTSVFIGNEAGTAATHGGYHVMIGHHAGQAVTTGEKTVIIGTQAGQYITTATGSTVIGVDALRGSSSTAVTGRDNTAIGFEALTKVETGERNFGGGKNAGGLTTTGSENTLVGYYAGYDLTTGDNNLLLGNDAGRSTSPSGTITTGDNNVCLGDNNIANLYCADTSISSSDKRDKTDVTNFTHGLDWVNKLNPITYRWDKRVWYNEYNEDGTLKTEVTPDGSKKRARQHIGFLAQDVLAIEQADGFAGKKDDMLVVNLNEDDTAYGLKYERLIPVLVNAIKELSTEVNTLKTKVAALESA